MLFRSRHQKWVSSLIFGGPLDLSISNSLLHVFFFPLLVVRMVKWTGDLCKFPGAQFMLLVCSGVFMKFVVVMSALLLLRLFFIVWV